MLLIQGVPKVSEHRDYVCKFFVVLSKALLKAIKIVLEDILQKSVLFPYVWRLLGRLLVTTLIHIQFLKKVRGKSPPTIGHWSCTDSLKPVTVMEEDMQYITLLIGKDTAQTEDQGQVHS